MKISKALARERKYAKRRKMQVDGRSIFTIENAKKKRAIKIKREREEKELLQGN